MTDQTTPTKPAEIPPDAYEAAECLGKAHDMLQDILDMLNRADGFSEVEYPACYSITKQLEEISQHVRNWGNEILDLIEENDGPQPE